MWHMFAKLTGYSLYKDDKSRNPEMHFDALQGLCMLFYSCVIASYFQIRGALLHKQFLLQEGTSVNWVTIEFSHNVR